MAEMLARETEISKIRQSEAKTTSFLHFGSKTASIWSLLQKKAKSPRASLHSPMKEKMEKKKKKKNLKMLEERRLP